MNTKAFLPFGGKLKGGGCLVGVDGLGCVLVRGGVCSGVGRSWVGWGWWWGGVRVVGCGEDGGVGGGGGVW